MILSQNWSVIQRYCRPGALRDKIKRFEVSRINYSDAFYAQSLLETLTILDLNSVCPGVASFYCWTKLNLQIFFEGFDPDDSQLTSLSEITA